MPKLKENGFEAAEWNNAGSDGRVLETPVAQGNIVCDVDLCLKDFINFVKGSVISSVDDRLANLGVYGTPGLSAQGGIGIIGFAAVS